MKAAVTWPRIMCVNAVFWYQSSIQGSEEPLLLQTKEPKRNIGYN